MRVKCIDASNNHGTGDGLLTEGKVYNVLGSHGGYYIMICDDGKEYTKDKTRFEKVSNNLEEK
ncbi:MAG: hypothetical protein PVI03_03985 [Candidatus Thorarchaeota archaeon]|jgi:hypothetical protein